MTLNTEKFNCKKCGALLEKPRVDAETVINGSVKGVKFKTIIYFACSVCGHPYTSEINNFLAKKDNKS